MKRRIIHIDEGKCTGCGLCVNLVRRGALALVDGKAKLMRDDYCDGLGNCLPNCPVNAISFIEREAAAFDEAAVLSAQREKLRAQAAAHGFTGCPGSRVKTIVHTADTAEDARRKTAEPALTVAGTDKACACERGILQRRKAPHCGRLHGLRLCRLP